MGSDAKKHERSGDVDCRVEVESFLRPRADANGKFRAVFLVFAPWGGLQA